MSADEIVDVVDTDNRVLHVVPKHEAHQKGLLHRTVISEVFDSQGRWTLVRPAAHKQDAGQWVSPIGGHVSSGETEEEALKREALEETGLEEFKYKLIGRVIYNREVIGRKENHYFILFEIDSDAPIVLNDEAVEHRKFTREELRRELAEHPDHFGPAFYIILGTFYPELLPA
jgi:isopentenyl-diphosphate Delta-isomerase